ncbi:hypothetical protein diail_9117, partial [Diaporthe ilicicola]
MPDNMGQLQLAVLGFSDQPGLVGDVGHSCGRGVLGGNGPSAIHQRWFALCDGQFHPAGPTLGPNRDSDSNSDSDPNGQPNIRLITVALLSGPVIAHHTEQLDACINSSDMDQVAGKVAEVLSGAIVNTAASVSAGSNATHPGQQPQQLFTTVDGVAEVVREHSPPRGRELYVLRADGSVVICTDGNGTGTGTGHEAFLRALDRSAD